VNLFRLTLAAIVALAVLTACGGPAAAPTTTPLKTPAPAATSPAAATPTTPTATGTSPAGATPTTPTATGSISGQVDPCTLLTLADVSAATGKTYTSIKDDGFGQCMWNTTEVGNTGDLIYGALQAQQLSFIKSSFGTGGVDTTVSGHLAFWNPTEGLDSLWVDVGNGHLLVLSFPRSGELDPSYKAIAEALAATAIGNL
jgi:hypothetical protein